MFDDIIQTNLKGTFLVNQLAAQSMIDANLPGGGSIINISSVSGTLMSYNVDNRTKLGFFSVVCLST